MSNSSSTSQQQPVIGLSAAEVEESRHLHGKNVLTPAKRESWWVLYLEKYDDPVIRILLIAALMAIGAGAIKGDYVDGLGIIIAVLLATTLAFMNEFKARKEFDILNKVSDDVKVKVVREGIYTTVPRKEIVVGDVVLLDAGEEVPADARVLDTTALQIDESRLTGESAPVAKQIAEVSESTESEDTGYPVDMVLRGTLVSDGHGVVRVTAVGDSSEIGVTAREAARETGQLTPLNRQLSRLSKVIGVLAFLIAALIYVALAVRGVVVGELVLTPAQWYVALLVMAGGLVTLVRVWAPIVYDGLELLGKELDAPEWLERRGVLEWLKVMAAGAGLVGVGIGVGLLAGWLPKAPAGWFSYQASQEFLHYFMIAVTIIVVAVPEGLAMSVTLSLAYSMRKMARANNLVRRMHACETIGAATVICSDKTGTLTQNRMRVFDAEFPAIGERLSYGEGADRGSRLVVEGITANTTAQLSRKPGEEVRPLGNPTEGALLLWLDDQEIDYAVERQSFPIEHQWTFSTERKFMGTLGPSGVLEAPILHVKGAPEIVLARCGKLLTGEGVEALAPHKEKIERTLKGYQARGMRTLGFAYLERPHHEGSEELVDVARDMVWLGFVAIIDPIRSEVPGAVKACREAGISVKMVTGDNQDTALEIARQIGLLQEGDGPAQHFTGHEFANLSDEEAARSVLALKVLSRARPLDKMRMVQLLQKGKQVVAVTGDGTNDAPALNHADVGLAMGRSGTAVAKEASDIILLDDSFNSIANAVMWGRSLYENIQRFILFQLTINVAACCTALLGPFIGVKFPFTVTQMLWVNLIMDTMAALALATEPPHKEVMSRPPRDPAAFIVTRTMARKIFFVGIAFLVLMIVFLLQIQRDGIVTDYELSVFFTVFVLLQFWNMFNARCLGHNHSAFTGLRENMWFVLISATILLGQVFIVQFGGKVFRTTPLSLTAWLAIIFGTSMVLWIGEVRRWRSRRRARS